MPGPFRLQGGEFLVTGDVHLAPGGTRLPLFLKALRKADAPFLIIGDLFDFWYERGRRGPRMFGDALAQISEAAKGRKVYHCPGNRDFMAGSAFRAAGIELLPERVVLGDTEVAALHGDLLARGERRYLVFRWFIRSWAFRCFSRLLPEGPAERLATAMAYRPRDPQKKGALDRRTAKRLIKDAGCRTLITGHFHPDCLLDYEGPFGRIIVLPCWEDQPVVLRVRPNRIESVFLDD